MYIYIYTYTHTYMRQMTRQDTSESPETLETLAAKKLQVSVYVYVHLR